MTKALAIAGLLFATITPGAFAGSALDDCLAAATDQGARVRCYTSTNGSDPTSTDDQGAATFAFVWLPACDFATPDNPGAESVSCVALLECDSPLLRLSLWSRQLTDADGAPVNASWSYEHSECRDPADVGDVRRQLTWQDVETAIRHIGIQPSTVTTPAYTLVNLPTTFTTQPHPHRQTLDIIGYTIDIDLQPATYTWTFGDGHTLTTTTPGRPYPHTDITHTYTHHTPPRNPNPVTVDIAYTARYRVDTGPWTTIPRTITIPGPTTNLPVKQASAVLVEP